MIRHGETDDNISKVYSRDATALTRKGIEQVRNTRKLIKDLEFDKVYYSPFDRTRETIVHLGLEGEAESRIQEADFGIFKGGDYKSILNNYPHETKMWTDDWIHYTIPEGESLEQAYKRVESFLEELMKKDEDVILITHEGIIRLVCCWIFDNIEYFFKFKADNASINIVKIVDGYKYIEKLNYSTKLE